MQEHEKNLLLLIVIGACTGFAKLLVSDEKLTWRLTIGRTILGAVNGKFKEAELVSQFRNAVAYYLREAGVQYKTDGVGNTGWVAK